MELDVALRKVALLEPPLNRLNRVPVLVAQYRVDGGHILRLDVVDDPQVATGERPRIVIPSGIDWWGVARKVRKVEDIPRRVGEMHELLAAKMLGLGPRG